VPAESFFRNPVHGCEPLTQRRSNTVPPKLQVFHHQPGRLPVRTPADRRGNAQRIAAPHLVKPLGLGGKHPDLPCRVELDEIDGAAVFDPLCLVNAAPADRPLPVQGGRSRKYYNLTTEGRRALAHSATMLGRMLEGVELDTASGRAVR